MFLELLYKFISKLELQEKLTGYLFEWYNSMERIIERRKRYCYFHAGKSILHLIRSETFIDSRNKYETWKGEAVEYDLLYTKFKILKNAGDNSKDGQEIVLPPYEEQHFHLEFIESDAFDIYKISKYVKAIEAFESWDQVSIVDSALHKVCTRCKSQEQMT